MSLPGTRRQQATRKEASSKSKPECEFSNPPNQIINPNHAPIRTYMYESCYEYAF